MYFTKKETMTKKTPKNRLKLKKAILESIISSINPTYINFQAIRVCKTFNNSLFITLSHVLGAYPIYDVDKSGQMVTGLFYVVNFEKPEIVINDKNSETISEKFKNKTIHVVLSDRYVPRCLSYRFSDGYFDISGLSDCFNLEKRKFQLYSALETVYNLFEKAAENIFLNNFPKPLKPADTMSSSVSHKFYIFFTEEKEEVTWYIVLFGNCRLRKYFNTCNIFSEPIKLDENQYLNALALSAMAKYAEKN